MNMGILREHELQWHLYVTTRAPDMNANDHWILLFSYDASIWYVECDDVNYSVILISIKQGFHGATGTILHWERSDNIYIYAASTSLITTTTTGYLGIPSPLLFLHL